jgi:hypothetical protein
MERPENTNGAIEKGFTTGMNVNRANQAEKDKASDQRKTGGTKK